MNPFIPYSIYGVIGYPLAHSLSPLLHTSAFKALNIPAILSPFSFPPEQLAQFFTSFKLLNIQGCAVTIPHKQAIIPFLDEVTDRVTRIGAANLIYRDGDKLCGDNTDVLGFMKPLQKSEFARSLNNVLILGAGGASRAIIVAIQDLGYQNIVISNQTDSKADALAQEFNIRSIPWNERHLFDAEMIINTTPLGMNGKFADQTPYHKTWFKGKGIVYDIVYTPEMTRFRQEAEQAGWQTISGLEMFFGQAEAQFYSWTKQSLPDSAKQLVIEALSLKH